MPDSIHDQCDQFLHQYLQQFPLSACVSISFHGRICYEGAFGHANQERKVANQLGTRFPIASISKGLTAALFLKLCEANLLALHIPVRTQFPAWTWLDERISPHHLLSHSSGLPDYQLNKGEILSSVFSVPLPPTAWMEKFCQQALLFSPGERFAYSNPGYYLLGQLMEQLSGQSLAELFQSWVFGPLGMKESGLDDPTQLISLRASPYDWEKDQLVAAPVTDARNFFPQGGLYATVGDLQIWHQALKPGKFLSDASLASMLKPHIRISETPKNSYGYGLHILERLGRKAHGHGGSHWGYRSHFERFPAEDFAVVVLSNHGFLDPFQLADGLTRICLGEPYELPQRPAPWIGNKAAVAASLGTYANGSYQLKLSQEGNSFFLRAPDWEAEVYPSGPGRFFHRWISEEFVIKEKEGKPYLRGCKKEE